MGHLQPSTRHTYTQMSQPAQNLPSPVSNLSEGHGKPNVQKQSDVEVSSHENPRNRRPHAGCGGRAKDHRRGAQLPARRPAPGPQALDLLYYEQRRILPRKVRETTTVSKLTRGEEKGFLRGLSWTNRERRRHRRGAPRFVSTVQFRHLSKSVEEEIFIQCVPFYTEINLYVAD